MYRTGGSAGDESGHGMSMGRRTREAPRLGRDLLGTLGKKVPAVTVSMYHVDNLVVDGHGGGGNECVCGEQTQESAFKGSKISSCP